MSTLIEMLEQVIVEHNAEFNKIIKDATDYQKIAHTAVLVGLLSAIKVAKQYSDWIDISVEPNNRTDFDSEVVLAIDVNGYTYNVTLADVVICDEKKREWTECKAKWNGEFWEAVEYICQSEKLVAYKHIPKPPSEVKP